MRPNLWFDQVPENGIKTPARVMQEEASIISKRTNNKVRANVGVVDTYIPKHKGLFMYDFSLETPARPQYSYSHFFITYDLDFYPVEFYMPDEEMHEDLELYLGKRGPGSIPAESEEEFIEILDYLLKSEELQDVVSSMEAWNNGKG